MTESYPHWVRGERVLVRAAWDGRAADVAKLAAQLLAQLDDIADALGGDVIWHVEGDNVADLLDAAALESLLAEGVERGDDGVAWPLQGYRVFLTGAGPAGFCSLSALVGAVTPGRRRPSNSISCTVVGPTTDGRRRAASAELAEAVLRSCVVAWDPESAAAFDRAGARAAADLDKFAPAMGQRTWVSDRVGAVTVATSGVELQSGSRGTWLSADDSLDPETAVRGIRTTLEVNGIDTIRRSR